MDWTFGGSGGTSPYGGSSQFGGSTVGGYAPSALTMPTASAAGDFNYGGPAGIGNQGAYNTAVADYLGYKTPNNAPWSQQTLTNLLGAEGMPSQVANTMWNELQSQNFAPVQNNQSIGFGNWQNDLQQAINQYNSQPTMQAPNNGGYGYMGGSQQPGQFMPNSTPPPWMMSYLQSQGWTPPANSQSQTQPQAMPSWLSSYLTSQGWTAPANGGATASPAAATTSPTSNGAPPWASALSGGYALPAFINQGSLPFASAQQWNTFMPQEQQAILGTAQSVGIDPGAYTQQMYAGFPEWGAIGPAGFQGY